MVPSKLSDVIFALPFSPGAQCAFTRVYRVRTHVYIFNAANMRKVVEHFGRRVDVGDKRVVDRFRLDLRR